jgi:hypothetical protein
MTTIPRMTISGTSSRISADPPPGQSTTTISASVPARTSC